MPLVAGTRLGPYEIVSAIGAGGMGEVYKARDTRLDRDVAIKVLPAHVAGDPAARERFEREAKIVSALDHPHICPLFDVGKEGGIDFLVMPYLEGKSLAERLAHGSGLKTQGRDASAPGLSLAETLAIATQIASALDAAHRKGVVHRDLKPGNVMLTPTGAKLLDFGLAKTHPTGLTEIGRSVRLQPDVTSAPTVGPSPDASLTTPGTILGTFQYMAPEQVEGLEADARTDVFAFGAVVYEMATGKKAFEGRSTASLMAAILDRDPAPMSTLAPLTPPAFQRVVTKCLAKERDDRWQTARDLLDELKWIQSAPQLAAPESTAPVVAAKAPGRRTALLIAVVALVTAALGAAGAWIARAPTAAEPIAFAIETPPTPRPDSFTISPDARHIAFIALDTDGQQKLWVRDVSSTTARVLRGTDQAIEPFWSPDSRTIAFFTRSELRRIDLAGGAAQVICRTAGISGSGTWNEDNVILFARPGAGILRVPAGGGEPQQVTTLDTGAGEGSHNYPTFLPGGRAFIYLKIIGPSTENSQLMWRSLESPDEHVVRKLYSKVYYSSTGHLLFHLGGPIVAQAFDASSGLVSGDVMQVLGDTYQNGVQTALALSPGGVLAHRSALIGPVAQLSWFDREGKTLTTVGDPADWRNPVVDLASERVATNTTERLVQADVWVLDGRRGTQQRITFDPASDSDPVFSPDGRSVAFFSSRQPAGIYRKATSGAGADELVAETGSATYPRDWSIDGRFLAYDTGIFGSLWVLPMDGDRKPVRFPPSSTAAASQGHFAPGGRWIAYTSDETGRLEVFVQDFPATGAKFPVSVMGGSEPRWRRDGRELYFLGADGQLMAVDVETKPEFRLGVPRALFQTPLMNLPIPAQRRYGVSADGQRFLMNVPVGDSTLAPITVIVNWQSLLPGR